MAGASVPDAGVTVACPCCGHEVLQKGMVPVLEGDVDGGPHVLICSACARDRRPDAIKASSPMKAGTA